jgi:RluA family pseudouridine synthase
MAIRIFYQDAHLAVVEKPAGVVVHSAPGRRPERTFLDDLRDYFRAELRQTVDGTRLVHRLDRGTSGLMVVARSRKAAQQMAVRFKERTISKGYVALVFGRAPDNFTVDAPLGPVLPPPARWGIDVTNGSPAKTIFRTAWSSDHFSLVFIKPITGRTHQIRIHAESKGHPIVGDPWYGKDFIPLTSWQRYLYQHARRLCLHAYQLEFEHPIFNARMMFCCPLPDEFIQIIRTVSAAPIEMSLASAASGAD